MAIRVSGLNSGLDTEAIVSALVSSYSVKKTKIEKSQTKLSWKQDAWKDANAKIYSLYTSLDNFRYEKSYNLKKATISDATKATISASNDAFTGSQK
ncbi:MAG: flagellar hook protein, partial [Lachnospiraceae bacterium]|nr:flagellar hook protein [Lachnospiraceae bacterium]